MIVRTAKKWTEARYNEWVTDKLRDLGGKCPGPCGQKFVLHPFALDSKPKTIFHRYRTLRGNSEATIDHIRPRAIGGSNALDNLTIMCRKCNGLKSDKHPAAEWSGHGGRSFVELSSAITRAAVHQWCNGFGQLH